jgi:Fic family protein
MQSRRRRLRALFAQHGQLTRAEVIRVIGCSASTATEDLRALEEEGMIHRVQTSRHLRTSYFIHVVQRAN